MKSQARLFAESRAKRQQHTYTVRNVGGTYSATIVASSAQHACQIAWATGASKNSKLIAKHINK